MIGPWSSMIFCAGATSIACCAGGAADRIDLNWLLEGGFAMAMPLCAVCVKADPTEQRRRGILEEQARRRAVLTPAAHQPGAWAG